MSSRKKYETWAKLNDEIGRMVGGWYWFDSEAQAREFFDKPLEAQYGI